MSALRADAAEPTPTVQISSEVEFATHTSADGQDDHAQNHDESWLADELLERVFG